MMSSEESDTFWQEIREQFHGSNEVYRRVLKAEDSDALVVDEDGCIVRCSSGFARKMGYSPAEMEGKKQIGELLAAGNATELEACLGNLLADPATPSRVMDITVFDRSGHPAEMTVRATALPGIRQVLISESASGGTDVRENDIPSAVERYRMLLEMTGTCAALLDGEGNVLGANAGFIRITGHERVASEGRRDLSDFVPKKDFRTFLKYAQQREGGATAPLRDIWGLTDGEGQRHETAVTVSRIPESPFMLISGIDLTGLEIGEGGRETTEALYQSIFETTSNGTVILDKDGMILLANQKFVDLVGYAKAAIEGQMHITEFLMPEHRRRLMRYHTLRREEPDAAPKTCAIPFTGRDGDVTEVLLSVDRIPGTDKSVLSGMDITGRKRAEKTLKESENRFRKIFEGGPIGMVISTPDFRLIDANSIFCEMTGYSREELKDLTFRDLTHPDDLARDIDGVEQLSQGRIPYYRTEKRYIRKNGEIIHAAISISAIAGPEGSDLGYIGMIEDITGRKQVEEALRESEERFRMIVETAPSMFVITDAEGKIVYASPNIAEMTGCTPEEICGGFHWWVHEDDQPAAIHLLERACRTHEGYTGFEYKAQKKNGEVWFASSSWKPVITSQGEFRGFVLQTRDITDQKKAKQSLIESEKRYRSFVENFQGVAFECDSRLNPVFCHGAVEAITGFRESELLAGKIGLPDLILPEDFGHIMEGIRKLETTPGYSIEGECRILTKQGLIKWIYYHIRGLSGENGMPEIIHGTFYDITDRKIAEDALSSLERQLQTLAENSSDVIYRLECIPALRFTYMSAAVSTVFGYSPDEIYANPQLLLGAIHPDDKDRLTASLAGENREGNLLILRWIRKDGTVIWTEHRDVPFFDESGNLIAIEGICRDITDRTMAERRLRDSEERYRSLVDLSPEPVFVVVEGKIRYSNPSGVHLLGKQNQGELANRSLLDLFPENYREHIADKLRRISTFGEKAPFVEEKIVTGAGDEIDVEVGMVRISYEGDPATQIIIRDISHRKEAEEALRQSREQYRLLVEGHPEPILIHADGHIVYINPAGIRYFGGAGIQDLLGMPLLDLVHEDERDRAVERIQSIYREGMETPLIEEKLLRLDGAVLEAEVRSVPSFYEGRRAIQTIIRDISLRKRAEEEIRRRNNQLSIINQIIRVANSSLVLNEMLEISLKKTIELLDFEMGWVYLKHPDGIRAELIAHDGISEYFVENGTFLNIRDWPNNMIFFAGQPRYIENLPHNPPGIFDARLLEDVDALCLAGVPLIADSVVVGALYMGRREGYSFSEEEKITLESIGKEIGGTILRGMLQDQLEEAYEEASLYLEVMEHDIKTANASILGYLNLIRETIAEEPSSSYVDEMATAVLGSMETISNVATIRRINEEPCPCIPVDLDAVIRAESEQFPGANISYHDTGYQIYGDELLSAVFINLIGNSIKFGGPDVEIRITVQEDEEKLTVSVEDTGCGVPDANKQEIFDYFQKTSPEATGRGLGLHVCRLLVERYGGTIWAEDRIAGLHAEGLAIRFTLYIAEEE